MAAGTTRINVHVTPRSGRDEVVGLIQAEQGSEVRVRVRAVPDKGKANEAVCKLIAKSIGVPKSAVGVVSGSTSHHKALAVDADPQAVEAWLAALAPLS